MPLRAVLIRPFPQLSNADLLTFWVSHVGPVLTSWFSHVGPCFPLLVFPCFAMKVPKGEPFVSGSVLRSSEFQLATAAG